MEKIPSTGPEAAPAKPTIHRSRFITSAMVGLASMASVAKAQEVDLPSAPAKNMLYVETSTSSGATEKKTVAPKFELKSTEDRQLTADLFKLMSSDLNEFVEMVKTHSKEVPFDVWCEFAKEHPGSFLLEHDQFAMANGDKLMYIIAAIDRSDMGTISNWLYHYGGVDFLIKAFEDPQVPDFYRSKIIELKLATFPTPDEVREIIKKETHEQRDQRLVKLMKADFQAFTQELKGRTSEALPNTWNTLLKKYPERYLQNFDSLTASGMVDVWHLDASFDRLDLISISKWLHTSDRLQKLEESVKDDKAASDFEKWRLEQWKQYPSAEVAKLIVAFYLKHNGRAVQWDAVAAESQDYVQAQNLLEQYPAIVEWVKKNPDHSQVQELDKAFEKLRYRGDSKIKDDITLTKNSSADVMAWSAKFGVENPYLLAREAVLVTRDMKLRGVDFADKVKLQQEIETSIKRIEEGREEARKHRLLQGVDVAVLISGDLVKKTVDGKKEIIYDLEDKAALAAIQHEHRKRNPDGKAKFRYLSVPHDKNGKVTEKDITIAKAANLQYLGSTGLPRAVFISMHGSPNSVSLLGDPTIDDKRLEAAQITVEDLVRAHKQRLSHPEVAAQYAAGRRDTYALGNCSSFDLAKGFFAALQKEGVPLPVIIASGDSAALSMYTSAKQTPFLSSEAEFTTDIAKRINKPGLEGLVDNAHIIDSNEMSPVVIFMPDKNNRPMQVTDVQPQPGGATTSAA